MLDDLKKDATFRAELEEVWRRHRRPAPVFYPTAGKNTADAVDQWKYESGWLAGFDFLFSQIAGVKQVEKLTKPEVPQ